MKYMLRLVLLLVFSAAAMEEKDTILFEVPSLRLLSFLVVKNNMKTLGHKVDAHTTTIVGVIDDERLCDDPFEKANLVDIFRLTDLIIPTAKELAKYIDSHQFSNERMKALDQLARLPHVFRIEVAKYRTK